AERAAAASVDGADGRRNLGNRGGLHSRRRSGARRGRRACAEGGAAKPEWRSDSRFCARVCGDCEDCERRSYERVKGRLTGRKVHRMAIPNLVIVKNKEGRTSAPEAGLKRRVLAYNEKLFLAEHEMEKGWAGTVHSHPHEQIVYVVHGHLRVKC